MILRNGNAKNAAKRLCDKSDHQITDIILLLPRDVSDKSNRQWDKLLRTVVNCIALQRMCSQGVGMWLSQNHPDRTEKRRKHVTEILTQPKMLFVNPKLFNMRELYNYRTELVQA